MADADFKLTHRAIAGKYKLTIAATLGLLFVENLLLLVEPLLLGHAIDGLIAQDRLPFWFFVSVMAATLVVGVVRRIYDTRAYGRIYREVASAMVVDSNARDVNTSQIIARASFVSEFSDFFEYHVPLALMSFITLIGSIMMLSFISPTLSGGAVITAILVSGVFFFSRKRINTLNAGYNDELERRAETLTSRDNSLASSHFGQITRWKIRLSDLEARNFGLAFAIAIILIASAVYLLIAVEQKSEGQIIAALTYLLQFTDAVIMLPATYQEFVRTREIGSRITSKDEAD